MVKYENGNMAELKMDEGGNLYLSLVFSGIEKDGKVYDVYIPPCFAWSEFKRF